MYNFIDVTEVSEVILPSEALKINGKYIENLIPGYRTLNVSGREALSPELVTFETGARDGSTIKSKRYPARIIIVKYQLIAKDNRAFREAYNKLAGILDIEDAELIFDDEDDKYYIGTPSAIGEVEPGSNSVVGEFEIFCADPFKYSIKEYELTAIDVEDVDEEGNTVKSKRFEVDYGGTYKAFPTLEADFYEENETSDDGESVTPLTGDGDCGFVAFFNDEGKIIQIGDPDETDGSDIEPSQTLVNQSFEKANSWGTAAQELWALNVGTVVNAWQRGSMRLDIVNAQTEEYCLAGVYSNISASGFHGPTITRTFPADAAGEVGAKNFTLTYSQLMYAVNTSQRGGFQAMLINASESEKKILAGVTVLKGAVGNTATLSFYVNDKCLEKMNIDLTTHNIYFGADDGDTKTVKTSIIKKEGDTISFNVGGIKKVYTVPDIAEMQAHEVTFALLKNGSFSALYRNGLFGAKFVKDNCTDFQEIPNKFTTGDVLTADCKTGEIFLNNAPTPEYGTLGNEWEEFCLKPGVNFIGTAYSDWVEDAYAPTFKMRYREVFL